MNYQLRIQEPSGEIRFIALEGTPVTLGRSEPSQVILKDPTVPSEAATLWPIDLTHPSPFWIKFHETSSVGHMCDFGIREAQVPTGVPIQIGETQLTIEPHQKGRLLPTFPHGVRHWLTASESGKNVLWTVKKSASTSLSIYLAGETGTGKEVLANLIHAWSGRKAGPFVPLHCGALPVTLAESELFGHTKGAFTGADQTRPGALLQAHGGTLFLDEIGDLPIDIQVKLLRFLENGEIRPLGSDRTTRVDVRIVCATHHPLEKLVQEGKFRRDLYFRLASVSIQIPPLRTRPEDVELLARKFSSDLKRTLSPRALSRLRIHNWPGNVRELQHAIERACGLSGQFQRVLGEEVFDFLVTPEGLQRFAEGEQGPATLNLGEMERILLVRALKLAAGNRAQAARILGVARSTLFEMIKRHKIVGPRGILASLTH